MPLSDVKRLLKQTTGLESSLIGGSAVERAISKRRRESGRQDTNGYLKLLRESPQELQTLIESVVVPETSFFRDADVFPRLAAFAADWMRSSPQGPMRLLSLPCATGEEPYSMAMTLLDAGLAPGRFRIDAIDISNRCLSQARIGIYGDASFRGTPLGSRRRHFSPGSLGLRVNDAVRRSIRFAQGNLLSDPPLCAGVTYDVVFCRNLLIYFSPESQQRALGELGRLVDPGGMLFVGPAEAAACITHGFVPDPTPRAFAFRHPSVTTWVAPAIRRTQDVVIPQPAASLAATARAGQLDQAGTIESGIAESTRLANLGRLEDAARACRAAIASAGPTADALHLLGVILDADGRPLEAIKCYRQAIYLDPQHEDALAHLALALEEDDQNREAARLRSRARRSAAGVTS